MQANPTRTIVWFLGKAVVLYALFVVPWPGVSDGYRWLFREAGTALFYRVGHPAVVRFEKLDRGAEGKDTLVRLENRKNGQATGIELRSLYFGYRPTVFALALILATPIPWSRRRLALVMGLALAVLFTALRLWLCITNAYCDPHMLALYDIGELWRSLLKAVTLIISFAPATTYLAPLVIWGLVTFRRGDWSALMEGRFGKPPQDAGPEDQRSTRSRVRAGR